MRIRFDPVKDAKNIAERGIPVLAYLGSRLHAAVVTHQNRATHAISLRKSHWNEVDWCDQQKGRQDFPAG